MTVRLIDRSAVILGGTPVPSGVIVPLRMLMEHLEAGDRLDDVLDDCPTISMEQGEYREVNESECRHDAEAFFGKPRTELALHQN